MSTLPGARLKAALLLATLVSLPMATTANTIGDPLYVKNLSPVAGLLGLPSQRSADTLDGGVVAGAIHSSIANHYVNDSNKNEFLNLDGETVRVALDLRYGIAADWELQLEVPWLDHSGGELDNFIDDWHDFWGMSDGGRSNVPRDLLDYRYATRDGDFFGLLEDSSGLGDVSLSLAHVFYRDDKAVASLVLGYKFGTGDEDDFLGSGADDGYIALRFSGRDLSGLPLSWHGQAGYLRAGDSDLLEDAQDQNLWFAGLALDWQLAANWSLIAQLDSHAAPMDSDLKGVGGEAFMLTGGCAGALPSDGRWMSVWWKTSAWQPHRM